MPEAEAWVRREPPTGDAGRKYLRKSSTNAQISATATYTEYQYTVPPHYPTMQPRGYNFDKQTGASTAYFSCGCDINDSPQCFHYGPESVCGPNNGHCNFCSSRPDLIQTLKNTITQEDACNSNVSVSTVLSGEYPQGVSQVTASNPDLRPIYPPNSYYINYSEPPPAPGHDWQYETIKADYQHCGSPASMYLDVRKIGPFTCPPGFTATGANLPDIGRSCINNQVGTIQEYPEPNKQCPVGNPCIPLTGGKIQKPQAWDSAGKFGLGITYNSLLDDTTNAILGDGWTGMLLSKLIFQSGNNTTYQYIDEDGDVDHFTNTTGGIYRPINVTGRFLKQTSSSPCEFTIFETSRRLVYGCSNNDGRLLRIEYPQAPQRNLLITWSTTATYDDNGNQVQFVGVPLRAESGGRVLIFGYTRINPVVDCGTASVPSACNAVRLTEFVESDGYVTTLDYNSYGRLALITHPDGVRERFEYGAPADVCPSSMPGSCSGTPAAELLPALLTGSYEETPNGSGGYSSVRYGVYQYDDLGRAIVSTHPGDLWRTEIRYEADGTPVVRNIVNGAQYNERRISSQRIGVYNKPTINADKAPNGSALRSNSQTYDANGYPYQATDYAGSRRDTTYSPQGLLTETVEAANNVNGFKRTTQTDWNTTFNVPTERRTYKSDGTTLVAKQTWGINSRGQIFATSNIDPATGTTRTTTTAYCEQVDVDNGICPIVGLVKSVDGPRTDVSDITTYTYYQTDDAACATAPTTCPHRKGDLWKVSNALGQVTETLKYDGAGRVLSVQDPNGVITDFEYHPRGWLAARKVRGTNNASETDDQITQIDYWPTGLVKKVTQPDGAFTSYAYDAAHRLTDIADNDGNTIHYTLDNAGNRIKEDTKDPSGTLTRTLSRSYDALNQLSAQLDAQGHQIGFTYDANGNSDTITDPRSHITDNDYDPLNRLSKTLQDVGGIAAQTQFAYDALDNLTQVTDPKGLNTTYTYNGLSDLLTLQSPDTGTTIYTYDSGGNRKTQKDAKLITATYGYDALNRLASVSYPTTSLNVAYTYDTPQAACTTGETFGKGRLAKITDASGSTSYCYDRFGNLLRKVQVTNGKTFTVRYGYDAAGRMISLTYPDGRVAGYGRNDLGQISDISLSWFTSGEDCADTVVSDVAYAPFGAPTSWTSSSGNLGGQQQRGSGEGGAGTDSICVGPTTYRRGYTRSLDTDYRPDTISDGTLDGLSYHYGFDVAGNLTQLDNAFQSTILAKYRYDGLNRLDQTQDGPTSTPIETYGYNTTGDRTSFTNNGGTKNYTYPASNHRLVSVGGVARVPDNNGNTTSIGGTAKAFRFNDANRLDQVKANGTVTMNYVYNGKGEQVRRYLGTTNTYTVYDEAGHWLGDYDDTGAPIQQAVWLDDLPVGVRADKLYTIEPDHLGTPRAIIDPTRDVVVWRWDLNGEVFGNTAPNQNPDLDGTNFVFNLRYPGQRYDSASGLNQNYFRDYEAATGRYVESDPIGFGGGIATYAYAKNKPTLLMDRFGLCGSGTRSVFRWRNGIPEWICVPDNPSGQCATVECLILDGNNPNSANNNTNLCQYDRLGTNTCYTTCMSEDFNPTSTWFGDVLGFIDDVTGRLKGYGGLGGGAIDASISFYQRYRKHKDCLNRCKIDLGQKCPCNGK